MSGRIVTHKEDPVSGKDIIQAYVKLRPLAVAKYHQLHRALDLFDTWDTQSKIGFLSQFLDLADILENNCSEIVTQFCRLKWIKVPSAIRQNFVDFLATLAVLHIAHVESVLKSVTSHFIPELKMDLTSRTMQPSLCVDDQEEIYGLAHRCVEYIISCCPRYASSLKKCCAVNFPHFRHPTLKIMGYIRNLIVLSEHFAYIAQELWSLIIDHIVHLDAASSGKKSFDCEHIFQPTVDEELLPQKLCTDELAKMLSSTDVEMRLDSCMAMILGYLLSDELSKKDFLGELIENQNFKWILSTSEHVDKFEILLKGFEEHVISAFNIQSVSFIWFYLSSVSEENSKKMLDCLWGSVITVRSPNEWKKSQHAAAFLGGFLAQANYISLSTTHDYLKKMMQWCLAYFGNLTVKSTERSPACVQHGLFYATVQATLFVICYRWREVKEDHNVKSYLQRKLAKILQCDLNPLLYVSHAIVKNFEEVNRHLNIIESYIVQDAKENFLIDATEPYFPFSFSTMKMCSPRFMLLMRRYVPCEEKRKRSAIVRVVSQEPEKKLRRKC